MSEKAKGGHNAQLQINFQEVPIVLKMVLILSLVEMQLLQESNTVQIVDAKVCLR